MPSAKTIGNRLAPPRYLLFVAMLVVGWGVGIGLLEVAARSIPLGTAYAVWGGIGAVGTVIVGMAYFDEPATLIRLLLILTIVAAIAGLKLFA